MVTINGIKSKNDVFNKMKESGSFPIRDHKLEDNKIEEVVEEKIVKVEPKQFDKIKRK